MTEAEHTHFKTPRVRFAPSPTGRMHVGHLRAAIPNALFARREGGTFIVRFEDTDIERQVTDAENLFMADFRWLGIEPDESPDHGGSTSPYNTLARHERGDYQQAVQKLMDMGRAYECFTTPDELDAMRKVQAARNEPPHYDNRHRDLTAEQKEKFRAEGRQPVIRFRLKEETIVFQDLVRGTQRFEARNLGGDPVIVRSNGVPLFTLGGVVDDIAMGITHVIRGEDHVVNTAQQVQIFQALGADLPVFAHFPMMLDKEGHKMSKRLGSLRVEDLRHAGYVPRGIVAYMAGLGFSEAPPVETMDAMAAWFDVSKVGRAPVRFDEDMLRVMNAKVLHSMPYAEAEPLLQPFMPAEALARQRMPAFWDAARENIETLQDVADWYRIVFETPEKADFSGEDLAYIQLALAHLPQGDFNSDTWPQWTTALKAATGRKGKALFMPLRLALTGQEQGPDMASLLPVIGAEAARERLARYV